MKLWKLIFMVWVFLWLLFLVRGFVKGECRELGVLLRSNAQEKKDYILGKELSAFIDVCANEIPSAGTYEIAGDLDEHNRYRLVYYLYPRLLSSEDPDYVVNIYVKSSQYVIRRVR